MVRDIFKFSMLIGAAALYMDGDIAAYAQDTTRSNKPEDNALKPLGINIGAFTAHPEMSVKQSYDSNIYRDETNAQSDMITTITPALNLKSNWSRHAIGGYAKLQLNRFSDHTSENTDDYTLGVRGRYDITHKTYLDAFAQHAQKHEERGSPDDANGDSPTIFDISTFGMGFTRALSRLQLFINSAINDYSFDNAKHASGSGSVTIDNTARDRTHYEGDVKLAYEAKPGLYGFTKLILDRRAYDIADPSTDRSSTGLRATIGADFDITGKLDANMYTGIITRSYDNDFDDINTPDFGAALRWNLSALTTLDGKLSRDVFETTRSTSSGYIRSNARLGISHDLTRTLNAHTSLNAYRDKFIGIDRRDDGYGVALGMAYQPFRGAKVTADYGFTMRQSNQANQDYDLHRLMLRAGYTF